MKTKELSLAAIIAALYVALTSLSASLGLAIGPIEFRFSEALTVLPVFTSAAIPGLSIGCLISSILIGANPWDLVLGTLATLIGAVGTRLLRKFNHLSLLPPILSNTLIIPPILYYVYGFQSAALPVLYLTFFIGETLSAGLLAFLLREALKPFLHRFHK